MIRNIVRSEEIFAQKAAPATKADVKTAVDLLDTLKASSDICVGMAANMIGVNRRIIACFLGPFPLVMMNPQITKKYGPYTTEEGCLSLDGKRSTRRYRHIDVTWYDTDFVRQHQQFEGFSAEVIQHEIDHCDGIVI